MRFSRITVRAAGPNQVWHIDHYHTERFHQGIGGQLIKSHPGSANDNGSDGSIACHSRLGGLMNYYHREAA
jgi:hypothetical protein